MPGCHQGAPTLLGAGGNHFDSGANLDLGQTEKKIKGLKLTWLLSVSVCPTNVSIQTPPKSTYKHIQESGSPQ